MGLFLFSFYLVWDIILSKNGEDMGRTGSILFVFFE